MKKLLLILMLKAIVTFAMAQEKQDENSFEGKITKQVASSYMLYLPDGYAATSSKWPLLVFLHGSGERGNDLEKVKAHGPPMLIESGKKFPFIVLSPQCPENSDFDQETLFALIESVATQYNVDRERITVTGLSMGGAATWDLALAHPRYFAAVAPVCGNVDRNYPGRAIEIKDLSVWVFHGANDDIVPLIESAKMVKALSDVGNDAKFTIYPITNHNSWTETYDNEELYEWLLTQKRK